MNAARAASLLETLIMGIDPITGETLDAEHVCAQPETLRALHLAVAALRNEKPRLNAGRPWTPQEDETLRQLYRGGVSLDAICARLSRRPRGTENRLRHLGLLPQENAAKLWRMGRQKKKSCFRCIARGARKRRSPPRSGAARAGWKSSWKGCLKCRIFPRRFKKFGNAF